MFASLSAARSLSVSGLMIALLAACLPGLRAEETALPPAVPAAAPNTASTPPVSGTELPQWDFFRFVDELPDSVSDLLPNKKPTGAVRLYLRPRYGDLIRRDYLRMPFGARWQVADNIEVTGELESYFTHGLGGSAGYGLSGLLLGVKREHLLPELQSGGISVGLNYSTPLSRPPHELTDGFRHLMPYIAATRPLMPSWQLLGYASLGADLLQHTAITSQFGKNELHANSLGLSVGAAREWTRIHVALTANLSSTALLSDERRQVFSLRPEVILPLRPATARTQVLLTVGSHAEWGPDGHDFGVSSSVRIESQLNRSSAKP